MTAVASRHGLRYTSHSYCVFFAMYEKNVPRPRYAMFIGSISCFRDWNKIMTDVDQGIRKESVTCIED